MSVNPVDTKQRILPVEHPPRILGFDAAGIVEQVGEDVTMFESGDNVFYSGSPTQHGSNEAYQLIEEELVAKAPANLTPEQAASLPPQASQLQKRSLTSFKFHRTLKRIKENLFSSLMGLVA